MLNSISSLQSAIRQDLSHLSNYYYEPKKTKEEFQRVLLSITRCVSELMLGMGAYEIWGALPVIGNNSVLSLIKGAGVVWLGYEIFNLTTNYIDYHQRHHQGKTTLGSHQEVGRNFLSFMFRNQRNSVAVENSGIYQEFCQGYSVEEIDAFVKDSLIPFVLRNLFKQKANQTYL